MAVVVHALVPHRFMVVRVGRSTNFNLRPMRMGKTVAVVEELSPDGTPLYVIVVDGKRLVKSGRKEFVEGLAVDFSKVVDDLEAS